MENLLVSFTGGDACGNDAKYQCENYKYFFLFLDCSMKENIPRKPGFKILESEFDKTHSGSLFPYFEEK